MGSSLAGGRYRVRWHREQWVVRTPDGRVAMECGTGQQGNARAHVWADRANDKLKAVEQR